MQTKPYRGIVALGCALTQSGWLVNSAARQRLKLTVLLGLGLTVAQTVASVDFTPEQARDWEGVQAVIEFNNAPKVTTNDVIRILEIHGTFSDSKVLITYIGNKAYDNPHLTFSMTERDVARLKRAGATPALIAAMRSPVSVAHPPEVVTLPQPTRVANAAAGSNKWTLEKATALGGVAVADITDDIRMARNLPKDVQGAVIAEIEAGSPAAKAGLREGDVIQEVNNQPVKNAKELVAMSKEFKPNQTILINAYSQGHPAFVVLRPSEDGSSANRNSISLSANTSAGAAQTSSSGGAANIELIIDASGSMAAKIQGRTKMEIAKQALTELLLSIPSGTNVAVRAYGHRRKDDCSDIELLANFSEARSSIPAKVGTLKPLGKTPLSNSITQAARDFAGKEGQENTVILITDGEETCSADPCAAAKAAHESGIKVKINVIGFKIEAKERAQLECIANAGGGKYVSANDAAELTAATKEVAAAPPVVAATPVPMPPTPAPTPTPPPSILEQSAGGQLLVAPNDNWTGTNDGKEEGVELFVGDEAVYAFKDEQPAKFDRFSTLVSQTDNANLKEFELLAGDESPTGTFRSIGKFTVQNAKMLKSPYQEFKFEPVTAKYLKIKILSNYGGTNLYAKKTIVPEFKVFGETNVQAETITSSAPEKKPEAPNILAQSAGGQLLAASSDEWQKTNDGKEEGAELMVNQEAVYAFKDEKPATFDRFATLVLESDKANLKEFELLAGDESPTGNFRSIGTFTVQNVKMVKSPYQEFKFAPVTAKYLKVKILSNYGGTNLYKDKTIVPEFKLLAAEQK